MMRRLAVLIGCLIVLLARPVGAEEPLRLCPVASSAICHIAIQHNGRHKPFDSFAREVVKLITGQSRYGAQDPVETALSIICEPERWQQVPLVSIPFVPLREALGMNRTASHISYNDLVASRRLMRRLPAIVEKQRREEKLPLLDNETMDAFQRFVALSGLLEQRLELVPPAPGTNDPWVEIAKNRQASKAWDAFVTALRRHDPAAVDASAGELSRMLLSINPPAYPPPWRLQLEVFYNRAAPFSIARLLYLLAALGLIASLSRPKKRGERVAVFGMAAFIIAFTVHAAGILTRVTLGGRPPVSNFFETMLWLPFVAVLISLVFERLYRPRYFAVASSFLAAIMLWLADVVPLDSSITPVVAVLRSNLWLTVHVLTIVASYGAIALATGLAHIYGWLYLMRSGDHKALKGLDAFLYRALQVGVVLLAGGIMLGAVWANASWGRYWGWDPKETWALITLIWYLALLHGRFAGWINGVGVALATIGGFFLLLMTYYGVSFYLVGLHSYAGGHAKPLPVLLVAYLIAETAFLAVVGLAALSRRRPA